jgi:hypothetical protein
LTVQWKKEGLCRERALLTWKRGGGHVGRGEMTRIMTVERGGWTSFQSAQQSNIEKR